MDYPQGSLVSWEQFCADLDAQMAPRRALEMCDVNPWLQEIAVRLEEARAAGSNVVNLGYTHPRGYFPNQILRRSKVRELMKQCLGQGWFFSTEKFPPEQRLERYFNPKSPSHPTKTLPDGIEYAEVAPYLEEIKRRQDEADRHFYLLDCGEYGIKKMFLSYTDLTSHHPRGEIPSSILKRIDRRKDQDWIKKTREEIDRLFGEANKATSFAKTQDERAEGVEDPAKLKAAAKELRDRAEQFRWQARWLSKELGEVAA